MLAYLDTRDLIQLLEHDQPLSAERFAEHFERGRHQLVVSFSNVRELAQPLSHSNAKTIVTRVLNRLESLPLRYIREAYIKQQELQEAFTAYSQGREYESVCPLVNRFDEACTPLGQMPASAKFLNFGLAETVFTIYGADPQALKQPQRHSDALRNLIGEDRNLGAVPDLKQHFTEVIGRDIAQSKIAIPAATIPPLAGWIYENPVRCPGTRIGYEIYHALRTNRTDIPKDGDIIDIAHAMIVPYVDLLTLDARMRDYVRRVGPRIIPGSVEKVCEDLGQLLQRL